MQPMPLNILNHSETGILIVKSSRVKSIEWPEYKGPDTLSLSYRDPFPPPPPLPRVDKDEWRG